MIDEEALYEESEMNPREPSELTKEVIASRPTSGDPTKLLGEFTQQLERMADEAGLSVPAFLEQAEHSPEFSEAHLEALSLARRIARLKTML